MGDRREFLKKSALLGFAAVSSSMLGNDKTAWLDNLQNKLDGGKFTLPALPYAYDALEPFIDRQTMEIHHAKHHQGYVDKLNAELDKAKAAGSPQTLDEMFKAASKVKDAIRNNAGGHYNHSLFWQLMKPNGDAKANLPEGKLGAALLKQFKSFDNFKKEFSEKAVKLFGSGWCWLIDQNGTLKITTTPNQDNPMMDLAIEKGKIVLGLDIWEHAYYLKHQNKRADYISAWWNVVNWARANELYLAG